MTQLFGWRKSSYSNGSNSCVEVGAWRKSSYSNGSNACVEATLLDPTVAVRDSKNPTGPVLEFPAAGWARLLSDLPEGEPRA